jgi:hypothetical protein
VGMMETIVGLGGGDVGRVSRVASQFFLQAQFRDMWLWWLDTDRGYSVRGAYQLLTSHPPNSLDVVADLIWHK